MDETPRIRTDFTVEDRAIAHLHALAFGGSEQAVAPWGERLRRHGVTWAGAFLGDELVAFVDYEPHLEPFYRDSCGFEGTAAGLIHLGSRANPRKE
jgi:hypothetical protein